MRMGADTNPTTSPLRTTLQFLTKLSRNGGTNARSLLSAEDEKVSELRVCPLGRNGGDNPIFCFFQTGNKKIKLCKVCSLLQFLETSLPASTLSERRFQRFAGRERASFLKDEIINKESGWGAYTVFSLNSTEHAMNASLANLRAMELTTESAPCFVEGFCKLCAVPSAGKGLPPLLLSHLHGSKRQVACVPLEFCYKILRRTLI